MVAEDGVDERCDEDYRSDDAKRCDDADRGAMTVGTEKIEGISLDMSKISDIYLNPSAFANISRLRVLKIFNSHINKVHVPSALETNFLELRYFIWHGCPIKSPLSSFYLENLVKLDMSYNKVEQLWNGCQPLVKLEEVDLSFSSIISCPDFSGSPNLKRLILQYCKYLCEISPSIQYLIKLDFLQLEGCGSLKGIPDCSGLNSLKTLHLSRCSNLEMLPEMPCNIEELWLIGTAIEELPLSTENLNKLQDLSLSGCKRLKSLPSSICKWKSLQRLDIDGCSKLNQLPSDIGALESLEELHVTEDPIRDVPSSFIYLKNLTFLSLIGCKELPLSGFEFFPDNLNCLILSDSGITELPEFLDGCLCSLRMLDLSGSSLESIPASIINLSNLYSLVIRNCKRLKCLPKLQLGDIQADGCTSLEVLPSLSFGLRDYVFIWARFVNCFKLDQNIFEDFVEDALLNIKQVRHSCAEFWYPGSEIPKYFRSVGSFINVELPPNWFNNNFLGFAICVVVSNHPIDFEVECNDDVILMRLKCNFKSKDGHQFVWDDYFGSFVDSNHVFVDFPILPFSLQELLCYENEVSFEFRLDTSSLKIEKCGVHLMFGEEVDGSSWVGEDEDVLSLANVHDNGEEKIEGDTQLIKQQPNIDNQDDIPRMSENCEGIVGRRSRDGEHGSRSGSDNMDDGSGDDQDTAGYPPRKKRYHRQTSANPRT
ncbi:hypothetical protein EZV62_005919 [Acer yangbiense]|uniref:Uncharacterized protein n=1 Tax=Acer yangbiense TaxID=1000413 RepID=A0A5C7IQA3_9ROSI|nr:hypothetical protein EZV62_005919 [Acer yangbiense]